MKGTRFLADPPHRPQDTCLASEQFACLASEQFAYANE